jgi:DNA (cytosine-5)-methyltransferase 1
VTAPEVHDKDRDELVIDLFAGPGGWDEGARLAGFSGRLVGIEHDWAACKTAMAAGHQRIQADVATFPLEQLVDRVTGLLGSPPCTSFSGAGHGAGRLVTELLLTAMTRTARGHKVLAQLRRDITSALRGEALKKYPKGTRAQRSAWCRKQATVTALVLQPLRYILAIRPQWIALEQVREVAPLWRHLAMLLREMGYNAWSGVLSAERFGVPQTRVRAVLVARLDGPVSAPEPTHQAYRKDLNYDTAGDLFGDPLPPPVSMADALGWGLPERPAWTITSGGVETGGAEVFGNAKNRKHLAEVVRMAPGGAAGTTVDPRPAPAPAHTITGKGTAAWVFSGGAEKKATERGLDEPAPTVFSQRSGNLNWKLRNGNQQNACERRACEPAGTLFFSARTNAVDLVDESGTRRVTVEEAAALQSFPPGYPFYGTKSQKYRQVGDAVPPLLSAAVLRQFFSATRPREAVA